jgi:plasmid stabilization system protein ParE
VKTYKTYIEEAAEHDLRELNRYLTHILKAPDAARRLYREIKEKVSSPGATPYLYPKVKIEPFRSYGVRYFSIGNYLCFYLPVTEKQEVHVLRILYAKRSRSELL